MEEITDLKNREGFWKNLGGGVDAFLKKKTRIKPVQFNPGNYDLVILGCPVWLGNLPPALRTYVHQHKNTILPSAFFCTYAGKGAVKTVRNFMEVSGQNPPTLAVKNPGDSENSLARIREFAALLMGG